jgi:ADP-heptose:LPS heptosyltransferase
VLNLSGTLTPRETAAALRRCRLLVCHDSGPMHLAATQQTRCVALFGNYNRPRKWYPWGSGHRVIYEPRGVREISVQRVADEIDGTLETQDRAPETPLPITS